MKAIRASGSLSMTLFNDVSLDVSEVFNFSARQGTKQKNKNKKNTRKEKTKQNKINIKNKNKKRKTKLTVTNNTHMRVNTL